MSKKNSIADLKNLTELVIGACIEVHRNLGPGLMESTYEECLAYELRSINLPFERQKFITIKYKGQNLDCGYRLDLLVDGRVVVELKSVESILPVHEAQVLTYLKLGGWAIGLLIKFQCASTEKWDKAFSE